MAVPTTFSELNVIPASNAGLVDDTTAVNQIDNHLQAIYAFMASVYANSGNGWAGVYLPTASPSYTGPLTGGTGVVNLGSGQFYKAADGKVGLGTIAPAGLMHVKTTAAVIPSILDTGADTAPAYTQFRVNSSTGWEVGMSQASEGYDYRWCYGAFGPANNRMRLDSSGNLIQRLQGVPPTLSNQEVVLTFPNNSTLRLTFKGVDGILRSADIALT